MLKAVIFDMDGTLGDTLGLCVEAYRQCVKKCTGWKPEPHEVTHFFGLSDRGVLGGLLKMAYDDPALPIHKFVEEYEALHDALAPAPFPGAVEMLRQIKAAGLKLGLITGKEDYTAVPTIHKFGMDGLFDWTGFGKPTHNSKSERLQEAAEFFGLQPQEMIYVGDAPSDITQCRSAGVPIISAGWAPSAAAEEAACLALNPDYRLTRFDELPQLIQKLIHNAC